MYSGSGTISLDVGPYSYESSSSSGQIYETGESYYGTSFSTSIYCDKDYHKKYNVLTFTPDTTGTYNFSVGVDEDVALCVKTDLYYISLGSYDYNLYNSTPSCDINLDASTTYYIAIAPYNSGYDGDIHLNVSLNQ